LGDVHLYLQTRQGSTIPWIQSRADCLCESLNLIAANSQIRTEYAITINDSDLSPMESKTACAAPLTKGSRLRCADEQD
jgi:hypothetical protein